MTHCYIYVGDPDDPEFKMEGGEWAYNLPRSLVSKFPPPGEHYNALFLKWARERNLTLFSPDYDSKAVSVTVEQILDYLDFAYQDRDFSDWPDQASQLACVRHKVQELASGNRYLLIGVCI